MEATLQLLEAVKRRHGISSDYALAKILGVSRQVLSSYRTGTTLGDDMAVKVAEQLGVDPAAVLAAVAAERTKSAAARRAWGAAVKKLGGVTAAVLVAFGGGPTPPGASAGDISHNHVRNTQCQTRRRQVFGVALRWITAAIAAPAILAGCVSTQIDQHTKPPRDWPALRVIEHHLMVGEVYDRCWQYVSPGMKVAAVLLLAPPIVHGCAEIDFRMGECHIYVRGDIPEPDVLEHERLHCQGYDHTRGDATLARAWRNYKDSVTGPGETFHFTGADGLPRSYRRPL